MHRINNSTAGDHIGLNTRTEVFCVKGVSPTVRMEPLQDLEEGVLMAEDLTFVMTGAIPGALADVLPVKTETPW